eukprot:TRINITY_DN1909_c0_g3_i1.p1 TRINITY_DN1909_c0_g3~~TRINITY_DN1909_c0_g3_i1.p1  ORF type:complete len:206 (+),score=49.00 TRINITY_DN1909_c0_g3_i1:78-695(+)
MLKTYDYLFKCVIIGDAGVGKSALLLRFADDTFNENYLTTLGVDFKFKTVNFNNKAVKLQIWDTAGQEKFRTITNAYYKGAHCIVVVYDITNEQSFRNIEKYWINEIETNADKNALLLFVGNKVDLNNQKAIDSQEAQELAKKYNAQNFEVSAKESTGVSLAFEAIMEKLMLNPPESSLPPKYQAIDQKTLHSTKKEQKSHSKCC